MSGKKTNKNQRQTVKAPLSYSRIFKVDAVLFVVCQRKHASL